MAEGWTSAAACRGTGAKARACVGGSIVFLAALALSLLVKRDSVFSPCLFHDDLIVLPLMQDSPGLPKAYSGTLFDILLYGIVSICREVTAVKILMLFIQSACALLTFLFIRKSFKRDDVAIVACILAYAGPNAASVGNFIDGSYPPIGMLFFFAGVMISEWWGTDAHRRKGPILAALVSSILFVMAGLISPMFYLVNFCYAAYRVSQNFKSGFRRLAPVATVAVLPPVAQLLLIRFVTGMNHYQRVAGWTDYSIGNVLKQFAEYVGYTSSLYCPGDIRVWTAALISATVCLIVLLPGRFGPSRAVAGIQSVAAGVFLLSSFLGTLAAVLVVTRMHNRYVFAPTVFFMLFVFQLLDYLLSSPDRSGAKVSRFIAAAGIGLAVIITLSGSAVDQKRYSESAKRQAFLRQAIRRECGRWEKNAQVVIDINPAPGCFTKGYNHWSTWYLRHVTGRDDIIGLVGSADWSKYYPILPGYSDLGPENWVLEEKGGKTVRVRKQMAGLVADRVTYAYRYSNGEMKLERMDGLVLKLGNCDELFDLRQQKLNKVDTCRDGAVKESLANRGIGNSKVLVLFAPGSATVPK